MTLSAGEPTRGKHRPWRPGESGNPAGRPKGTFSLTAQLRKFLLDDPNKVRTLLTSLYEMATKHKNIQAAQEIFNRIDGKVIERHEIEGQLPIMLVFTPAQGIEKGQPTSKAKELPAVDVVEGEVISEDVQAGE